MQNRGDIQFRLGNAESAAVLFEGAFKESRQIGDVPSGLHAYESVCWSNLHLGRLDEIETWAHIASEDWMGTNDASRTPWVPLMLGIARLCTGDYNGASSMAKEISDLMPHLDQSRQYGGRPRLGRIYLALGARVNALDLYTRDLHARCSR